MSKFSVALKVRAKNGILQEFIDLMGWTQSDFAKKIGFSISVVGKWFNMQDYPRSEETMNKITTLVGKTPQEIFPDFLRNPEFLGLAKHWTQYREVDIEYLPFDQVPEIAYEPEDNSLTEAVNNAIADLVPREKEVIHKRFYENKTLEETARDLGITRERVRQIEVKSLRKLKHPSRVKFLNPHRLRECVECEKKYTGDLVHFIAGHGVLCPSCLQKLTRHVEDPAGTKYWYVESGE